MLEANYYSNALQNPNIYTDLLGDNGERSSGLLHFVGQSGWVLILPARNIWNNKYIMMI
jgi:hypothetical protein